MRYFFLLIFISLQSFAFGQVYDPVKWQFSARQTDENGVYELVFKASIEEGWYTYSQYLEEEEGPLPTAIVFDDDSQITRLGKAKETGTNVVTEYDPNFDTDLVKFKKDMTITQKVKLKEGVSALTLTGYAENMVCDQTKCLPPKAVDFSFKLTQSTSQKEAAPQQKETPEKAGEKIQEQEKVAPDKPQDQASSSAQNLEEAELNAATASSAQNQAFPRPAGPYKKIQIKETFPGELIPVTWAYRVEQKSQNEYTLNFKATIEEGWSIYSQFIDGDGPIPTSFNFEGPEGLDLPGPAREISEYKEEGPDPYFDGIYVTKFKKHVLFEQDIVIADPSRDITGYFEFMACDANQCLPPRAVDFSFNTSGENGGGLEGISGPIMDGQFIDQEILTLKSSYETPIGDCGKEEISRGNSHLWTFILGFLGGLIALLTPCVFPMIPLTVSFFTKGSKDRKSGIRNGVVYGISIIVIYIGIGLLITSFFGTAALNELSTNWIANTLFFAIFIFFAFSFFGYYELTLPSSWSNKSDKIAERGGLIGIFFMAFTLALVSFSCTGPIIGSAIVQSATSTLGPFIVMLGFSSALALPFGLFAAFPAWLNSLPKSGSWMNSVKVVLGFLELALAFKFLSVADMTMHWGILGYEVFMAIWILIFAGLTLYLFGVIRFPHDSPVKKLSPGRWAFALSSLALTLYLATGFQYNDNIKSYNSLGLMSGLAPPATYNYFLPEPEVDQTIKDQYPSFTTCANNLPCFKDYYEGVAYAREVNKPVLLDFTGYGCVNCRKTEEHIWVADRVRNKIANDFVLVSLYVDDRTPLDTMYISKSRQEKLRNIGNKWADFQIVNFEQNSQPLYIMMAPDEQILAKPRGYKEGVDDYARFLECGLNVYNNYKPHIGSLN
jgi:thiol:disulfide interchange protein